MKTVLVPVPCGRKCANDSGAANGLRQRRVPSRGSCARRFRGGIRQVWSLGNVKFGACRDYNFLEEDEQKDYRNRRHPHQDSEHH